MAGAGREGRQGRIFRKARIDCKAEGTARREVVRGAAWVIGVRWCVSLMGLGRAVFLAGLLMPADFGIVAIAGVVVGAVEVLAQNGQFNAVLRHPNPT